jgi:hypothetical protein
VEQTIPLRAVVVQKSRSDQNLRETRETYGKVLEKMIRMKSLDDVGGRHRNIWNIFWKLQKIWRVQKVWKDKDPYRWVRLTHQDAEKRYGSNMI